jgi:hypothetical protein
MAIDKRITGEAGELEIEEKDITEVLGPSTTEQESNIVEMMEDGSAIINPEDEEAEVEFYDNLAEVVEESELQRISNKLLGDYENAKDSRKDWEDGYVKGLDLLGFKYTERSQPFQGASGVTHPLLAESVTQFQAHAYKEMLPAGGPVHTQVIGDQTPDVMAQAERVKDFMNYEITHTMEEYDQEMDQMLFYLPLAGSTFKKVYYDASLGRAVSRFVPAEDLVIPYETTDLETAEMIGQRVRVTANDLRKKQVMGFYRDISLKAGQEEQNQIQKKYDDLEGTHPEEYDDDIFNLIEFHVICDIKGFEDKGMDGESTGIMLPYIITIDENSSEVLSIRRNYKEGDPLKRKVEYFVHYKFLPGLGFYGFGLIHMIGGLSRTATAALRQLLDAGTLSNLPAGFKARGLRIRDDDSPLKPGEFRDVDAPGGSIRDGLLPLPYKGPDQVLMQLLGFCVEAGTRFAAIADQKLGEGSQANPVGTTMAIMERGARVMSAIHKRLHHAQRKEFKILARVFAEYLPPEYPYNVAGGNRMIKMQDFDDRVDVIPVSDPNIFSMAQRITLAQTELQLAQSNPQIHNLYEAYRRMYEALGVQNIQLILPPPQQPTPKDPGMENAASLTGQPMQPFPGQNHEAHINAHRAFMSSYLVKNNPPVLTALQAHVSEHIALLAREQVEAKNAPVIQEQAQQFGGQIPPELLQQFQAQNEKEIAEVIAQMTNDAVAEEQEYLEKTGESDPLIDLKQQDLLLKLNDQQMRQKEQEEKFEIDRERIKSQEEQTDKRVQTQQDIANLRAQTTMAKAMGGNRGPTT